MRCPTLSLLPREVWETVFSSGLESQDLCAASLTCSHFKDIAQPLLFSTVKFTVGVFAVIEKSRNRLWYSYPQSSDNAKNLLQQLRFIASPKISNRIRKCKIEYEQHIIGHDGPSLNTSMDFKDHWILDQVALALSSLKLARWKILEFHCLPIFGRHLQLLLPTFSHARIDFRDCWSTDLELRSITLPFKFVTISYQRNIERRHGRVFLAKSILTSTLVHLDIRGVLFEEYHQQGVAWMLGTCPPLLALESLSMSEQNLDYLTPYLHLFSNISTLTISPRIASPRLPLGIPSESFPQLQTLECPVHLLSDFKDHSIRELGLIVLFPKFRYRIWPLDMKSIVSQNLRLLSQLSTLELIHVTALDNTLEEFLSHCHNLKALVVDLDDPLRPHDITLATTNIESDTQESLDGLRKIRFPATLEYLEIRCEFHWNEVSGRSCQHARIRLYRAILSSVDVLIWPPHLRRITLASRILREFTEETEFHTFQRLDNNYELFHWHSYKIQREYRNL